jgi:cytochrome c oxidase cbb3-type subunit 3
MKRMKKAFTLAALSLVAGTAQSQDAAPSPSGFADDPLLPMYLLGAGILMMLVLVLVVTAYAIKVLELVPRPYTPQQAAVSPVKKSFWKRFVQRMNASVPLEQESEIELDHAYDGIRELDNHLPPWWKWLFYGSMVWAVAYFVVFHVTGTLPLSNEEYTRELALAEEQSRKFKELQPQATIDEDGLEYTPDAALIAKGKEVFTTNNCGACHRADGGGNTIGPNLTDEYWLHGDGIKNVFHTIKNGVVEKGMPAWGKSMSAEDVRNVAFFVISLRGSHPPDAKAPQGERSVNDAQPHAAETKAAL